jgi:hypothetical protein
MEGEIPVLEDNHDNTKPDTFVNPYDENNMQTNQDAQDQEINPQIPENVQGTQENDHQNQITLVDPNLVPPVSTDDPKTLEANQNDEPENNFEGYYKESPFRKFLKFIAKHKHSVIASTLSFVIFIAEIVMTVVKGRFSLIKKQTEFVPLGFGYVFYIIHGIACTVLPFTIPFSLKTEIGSKIGVDNEETEQDDESDDTETDTSENNNEEEYKDMDEKTKKKMKHEKEKEELLKLRLEAIKSSGSMTIKESALTYNSPLANLTKGQSFRFFIRIYIPTVAILLNLFAGAFNDMTLVIISIVELVLIFYLFFEPPYYSTYKFNMKMLGVSGYARTISIFIVKDESGEECEMKQHEQTKKTEDDKQFGNEVEERIKEEQHNLELEMNSVDDYSMKRVFWCGEISMLLLSFAYLSVCIAAGGLSYLMFHRYLTGPVKYQLKDLIQITEAVSESDDSRPYLSIYSIFLMLVIGMGFGMSTRNSYGMILPFFLIAIGTLQRLPKAGIIIIIQLCIHIIYMLFFCTECTRNTLAGVKCECCLECCRATLNTVLLGDIVALALFAFPLLFVVGDSLSVGVDPKINLFSFAGSSVCCMIAVILHILVILENDNFLVVFFSGGGLAASGYLLGLSCAGDFDFFGTAVYECTYLAWSITLCLWCYPNGYSPLLFKLYNALISVGVLCAILLIDKRIFWVEVVCCVIQIIFDSFILPIIARSDTRYIGWVLFSISGVAILAFLVGVVIIIIVTVIIMILNCLGSSAAGCSDYENALQYANDHGLKSGDTFECGGKMWRVE